MLKVQNVIDAFERYKRDIDDVGANEILEWVQFTVNFIYNEAKGVDPERFTKGTYFRATIAAPTGNLPVDFMDLNQTTCGFYKSDTATTGITDNKIGVTGYGSTDEGYYLDGATVVFTGFEDQYLQMRYMPLPPVFTLTTDYLTVDKLVTGKVIVEDRHLEYMVKAVDVLYEQWDDDASKESLADFRFVRALGGILEHYNRRPQISMMKNPSDNF
jgi:hypothetical protein